MILARIIATAVLSLSISVNATELTTTSRAFAGLPTSLQSYTPTIQQRLHKHQQALTPAWDKLREERITAITQWRGQELGSTDNCGTMLYPFSGPDFINAYALFPNCDRYVFFGLERPGKVPPISSMSSSQLDVFLTDFNTAIGDILERNYFITSRMSEQLRTPHLQGVTPILLAAMVFYELQIESIAYGNNSVTITFKNPYSSKRQYLVYASVDASNNSIQSKRAFITFLKQHRPTYTLLKSASYLLQYAEFTTVRDVILEVSDVLVQDDTGVPYKFLTSRKWDVKLYGTYERPIAMFAERHQPDLTQAYANLTSRTPLPFSFGYRWRESQGVLILARRRQ